MTKNYFKIVQLLQKSVSFWNGCYILLLLSSNMPGVGWQKLLCRSCIFKTALTRLKVCCAGTEIFLVLFVFHCCRFGGVQAIFLYLHIFFLFSLADSCPKFELSSIVVTCKEKETYNLPLRTQISEWVPLRAVELDATCSRIQVTVSCLIMRWWSHWIHTNNGSSCSVFAYHQCNPASFPI